jgi:anti-sigma-K factor RskA
MTPPLTNPSQNWPEQWQDLIAGYALGDLTSEEAEVVTRLLAEHPELQSEINAYQEVLDLMPYALAPEAPPAILETQLIQTATARVPPSRQVGQAQHSSQRLSQRLSRRQWGLAWGASVALAASALLAFGFDNYRLRQQVGQLQANNTQLEQQLQSAQTVINRLQQKDIQDEAVLAKLSQPNSLMYTLAGTPEATQATGSLLATPGDATILVIANNLPTLSNEQIYRLWAVATPTSAPTFCGEFSQVDGVVSLDAPQLSCAQIPNQVIITVERKSDPPIPKGTAILQGKQA